MTQPSEKDKEKAWHIVYGKPLWEDDRTLLERIAQALQAARDEALEEAAKIAFDHGQSVQGDGWDYPKEVEQLIARVCYKIEGDIRALKAQGGEK